MNQQEDMGKLVADVQEEFLHGDAKEAEMGPQEGHMGLLGPLAVVAASALGGRTADHPANDARNPDGKSKARRIARKNQGAKKERNRRKRQRKRRGK
jgi:hypothetical protein